MASPDVTESPPRYRLQAPQPSEADLQGQIIDYLQAQQARGRVVWFARINGGGARVKGMWLHFYRLFLPLAVGHKGMSDLIGQLAGGRFFALEVKKPGERTTAEQTAFLDAVVQGGGLGAVVRNWEEVRALLEITTNDLV